MSTLEERVAYIEGQMAEQSHAFGSLNESVARLDRRMEESVARLDQRIQRFDQRMEGRFIALEEKVSRHFLWMVGIQITILMAVLGAVLSRAS